MSESNIHPPEPGSGWEANAANRDDPAYLRQALLRFAAFLSGSDSEAVREAASELHDLVRDEHYPGEFDA